MRRKARPATPPRPSSSPAAPTRTRLALPDWVDPRLLTVVSILLSFVAIVFTARVFFLAQRPIVGIVEHSFHTEGSPANAFFWSLQIKNVGNQPTWVTVKKNESRVTRQDGASATLPTIGEPDGGIYLMPGQAADLSGILSDAGGNARIVDVLEGRVRFNISVRLEYAGRGLFFRRPFYYWSEIELRTALPPPRFIVLSSDGS